MIDAEVYSWFYVYKEWGKQIRRPIPDKGFESNFREYIYEKIKPDVMSEIRDMGFGLSLLSLSGIPHELDIIFSKGREKVIFELKHYSESKITKEMIFSFLGKVLDFYIKNAEILAKYKITMFFVTISKNLDDSIRKLCLTYGIKLIEPSLMTLGVMDYFARDLYSKIPEDKSLKSDIENLIERLTQLKETYDHSFSDIFMYKDGKIEIDQAIIQYDKDTALEEIKRCYKLFEGVWQKWKIKK